MHDWKVELISNIVHERQLALLYSGYEVKYLHRIEFELRRELVSSSHEATTTRLEDHEEVHVRTAADSVDDRPPSRGSSYQYMSCYNYNYYTGKIYKSSPST